MKYYFNCPHCGNNTDFVKPTERDSSTGCLLLLFGGFIPFLLFSSLAGKRIQCGRCKTLFAQPGFPANRSALLLGALAGTLICVLFASVFFFALPGLAQLLPEVTSLSFVEEALQRRPRVALFLILTIATLSILPLWMAAAIITRNTRKEIKKSYSWDVPFPRDPRLPDVDTEFRENK